MTPDVPLHTERLVHNEHLVHIEHLVLDGFGGLDRAHLGAVVQAELARLLTERGVPPALAKGGEVARIEGGRITAAPDASAAALGAQIAHAVYRGFQP